MEYYLGILNRTFQIFVTPNVLAGALVNNAVADPGGLAEHWFVPSVYTNKKMVEKYEHINPESDDFKRCSPASNFQYPRGEIRRFWYDPTLKWGMGTVAHSGKLNMELTSGKKREFILLGLQQGKEILQYIQNKPDSGAISTDDSGLHALLKQAYQQQYNLEIWKKLAELFSVQGEKAQEHYCRSYIRSRK